MLNTFSRQKTRLSSETTEVNHNQAVSFLGSELTTSTNKFCPPFLSPDFMSATACCNLSADIFCLLGVYLISELCGSAVGRNIRIGAFVCFNLHFVRDKSSMIV